MRTDVRALGALAVFISVVATACASEEAAPSAAVAAPGSDLFGATVEDSASAAPAAPEFQSSSAPADPSRPLPTECPPGKWCSKLYPPTWSPSDAADREGRFLHDFSYAGYRNGETPPSSPPGAVYDVVRAFGADASGRSDASQRIQAAIDEASAAGGGVVFFPRGTFRIERTLSVTASGVVLRGEGARSVLRFPNGRGLTIAGSVSRSAPRPLAADAASRSNEILVSNAVGLTPGDDVVVGWTITPAFIAAHGMTGTWKAFNGQYQQMFRSQVVSVDTTSRPHRVVLDVPLRYAAKVRDGAAIQKESGYLREVGIESLSISNATSWAAAWASDRVHAITITGVEDAWVRDVHSVAAPGATGMNAGDERAYHLRSGGIVIETAKRVSVLRSSMENPQNRGGGGNGYLFEFSKTNEVLFADTVAKNGRHNFIQNWGFGNSGTVFLRCVSEGSEVHYASDGSTPVEPAASEHHHSLAMATLVDDSRLDDGFKLENRRTWSEGAGHTSTESVVWRPSGAGTVVSRQFGWGYVIGAHDGVDVDTLVETWTGQGTAPEDFVEGEGAGDTLYPPSLYEHQRARRLQVAK